VSPPIHCFISYRRDDTEGFAGWLADLLRSPTRGRPECVVFLDVDDIAPGENFVRDMVRAVRDSDIVLLLVGPRWMRASLQTTSDAVRLELEAALEHRVPIHILLVEGAACPEARSLPRSLQGLAIAPAHTLDGAVFDLDVARLVAHLQRKIVPKQRPGKVHHSQLVVVFANPGFWTETSTISINLDGKLLGQFSLSGGIGNFEITPGRHSVNTGRGLLVSETLHFDVAAGAAVKLTIHRSGLTNTRCTIEQV
jgi:hypothetical protein